MAATITNVSLLTGTVLADVNTAADLECARLIALGKTIFDVNINGVNNGIQGTLLVTIIYGA